MKPLPRQPQFPPVYAPVRLAEPEAFAAAAAAARAGAADGTLFWVDRTEAVDLAFVLRPDGSFRQPLCAAYAAAAAVGDALGQLLPPELPVHYEWPDRVLVNQGVVGGFRFAWDDAKPAGQDPEWIALGVLLAVEYDPDDEPGLHPDVTTFGDELGPEDRPETIDLVEAIPAHFLLWLGRWADEGFAPLARHWHERSLGYKREEKVWGRKSFWRVEGLDDDGTAVLEQAGVRRVLTLRQGLAKQSWWLPDRYRGAYAADAAADAAADSAADAAADSAADAAAGAGAREKEKA